MITRRRLLIGTGVVAGGIILLCATNPLIRSSDAIRQWLLRKTPLGSSREEVLEIIAVEGWRLLEDQHRTGVWYGFAEEHARLGPVQRNARGDLSVGVDRVRATIGEYPSPIFTTSVEVYWAFDENGNLINVLVRKTTDAL